MRSTKSADLIGHSKILSWGQLDGCSVTRPFLSLRRVWLARLGQDPGCKASSTQDAIFGDDVLIRCTVAEGRNQPGLPVNELSQLKQVLFTQFPRFWPSPIEFQLLWKDRVDSIGQACKRLCFKKPGQK